MTDKEKIIAYLGQFITERRMSTICRVLEDRTRYITVVLEDIYQPHNASAVLRTCECHGIQDVHIIENKNKYSVNPDVVLGATKWLNLHRYNSTSFNTIEAITLLRNQGYRIIATSLAKTSTSLDDFDISNGKAAIFFGTELTGLTKEMLDMADEYLHIPVLGFTESYNISVSAAIILNHLISQLRQSDIDWQLSQEEKLDLKLQWLKNTIKQADLLIRDFSMRNNT